jgi:hypothetical protein
LKKKNKNKPMQFAIGGRGGGKTMLSLAVLYDE